jgi:hypothetical protein
MTRRELLGSLAVMAGAAGSVRAADSMRKTATQIQHDNLLERWSREHHPELFAKGSGFEVWRNGDRGDIIGIFRGGELLVVDANRDSDRGHSDFGIRLIDIHIGNNVVAVRYGTNSDKCTLYGFAKSGSSWKAQLCDYPSIDGILTVTIPPNTDGTNFFQGRNSPQDVYRRIEWRGTQFVTSYAYMLGGNSACNIPVPELKDLGKNGDRLTGPRLIDQRA